MKIAFISYEYPPDTAFGGIATYVRQAAAMLRDCGHHVEVFAGSLTRQGSELEDDLLVHRLMTRNRLRFAELIAPVFACRHTHAKFDVVEGPDYSADARDVVRWVPNMPLVIKLHTPTAISKGFNRAALSPLTIAKAVIGDLRWGILPGSDIKEVTEAKHAQDADDIAAPSQAIGDACRALWNLDPARISLVPLPFTPQSALLEIPIETMTNTVTFIGRLEARKGVVDLVEAIPLILARCPQAKFQFVGAPCPSPDPRIHMQEYLTRRLGAYQAAVHFTGQLPASDIPAILAKSDIGIFPSLWESFGYVCLEAMAAGRGVIGSSAGGMAEILHNPPGAGLLVPPGDPAAIAEAICDLLTHPEQRMAMGRAARVRALSEYGAGRIPALMIKSYERAIEHRKTVGVRNTQTLVGAGK
jgi:glycogen synthase